MLIVGSGGGGVTAVLVAKKADLDVILIEKTSFMVVKLLFPEVESGYQITFYLRKMALKTLFKKREYT